LFLLHNGGNFITLSLGFELLLKLVLHFFKISGSFFKFKLMLLIISNVGIHLIIVVLHILVILIESLGELFTIFLLKKTVFFQDFGKIRFNFFHIYIELIHCQLVSLFQS